MGSAEMAFWLTVLISVGSAIGIYRAEVRRYGGVGMSSLCAAGLLVYALINPVMYMVHPLLAFNYALFVGPYQTAESLLPHVVSVGVFLLTACVVTVTGREIGRTKRRNSTALPPLSARTARRLFLLAMSFLVFGCVMYMVRNQIAYGSPLGSITTAYAREQARPQVTFWWGYSLFLVSGLLALSALLWWQTTSRRMPRWLCILPLSLGVMFAVVEGNRVPAAGSALFAIGWLGFGARVRLRHVVGMLLLATFLALLANARYFKAEHGFVERFADVVDPVHFRPFWSSDPVGPSVVVTIEAQRAAEGKRVSWGQEYLENFLSVVPRFVWAGRPENSVVKFAREFMGEEYAEDTGFAYSMIAESVVNFLWAGPIFLGVIWASLCSKVSLWCYSQQGGIGRVVFSSLSTVLPFYLPRQYIASLVSPGALANYFILGLICYICAQESRRSRRLQERAILATAE